MKRSELKTGMILEDKSSYAQKEARQPYLLVLQAGKVSMTFLRSSDPNSFSVDSNDPLQNEYANVDFRLLKVVR